MNNRNDRRWLCWSGVGVMLLAAGLTLPTVAQAETERSARGGDQDSQSIEEQMRQRREALERQVRERQQQQQQQQRGAPQNRQQPAPARDAAAGGTPSYTPAINPEWRQNMPSVDRTMMDALIGQAPPDFTENLQWHGHNPDREAGDGLPTWLQFRDRIVVVQSWTSANSAGRQAMTDAIDALSGFSVNDVALLLVHTPEGHDGASEHIEHASKSNVSIIVDAEGTWCDEAGIYRTPVNFIVDRNGEVRFAALNAQGITAAVESIIDESYDEHAEIDPLPSMEARLNVAFPTARGNTGRTPDAQGQIGPDVFVSEWFNDPPATLRGKTIKVEFWRTGCPHCINAIPKLNQTAETFRDDLVIVAITQEQRSALQQGLTRRNIDPDSFRYSVAMDRRNRTAQSLGVRGVPHSIVMSYDGIVRWQGHPAQLADQTLEQIIQANNALYARMQLDDRGWVKN